MFKFFIASIKLFAAFFCTLPSRLAARGKKPLMLVSEKGDDARDNGYHFFLHVKRNHPEVEAYYIITDNSPDRHRLAEYEPSLVRYLSFRHCCLFWRARYLVGTHLRAGHTPLPYALVWRVNKVVNIYAGKKVANIKHGITKGFIGRMTYDKTHYDLLVCGAAPEHDYFINTYHYPPQVARYTGFCRFDRLMDFSVKRQILVMPTWRKYIDPDKIEQSLFFEQYHKLLTSPRLAAMIDEHDIDLVFYPHHRFQPVVERFKAGVTSPRITVADVAHYDVQQLLKESALMITDYSSVLFDFVYMRKPVLFFQFDREEHSRRHIQEGYVAEESFGPAMTDVDSLLDKLKSYLESNLQPEPQYAAIIDRFFPMRDTDNCQRVFEAVMLC